MLSSSSCDSIDSPFFAHLVPSSCLVSKMFLDSLRFDVLFPVFEWMDGWMDRKKDWNQISHLFKFGWDFRFFFIIEEKWIFFHEKLIFNPNLEQMTYHFLLNYSANSNLTGIFKRNQFHICQKINIFHLIFHIFTHLFRIKTFIFQFFFLHHFTFHTYQYSITCVS